MKKYLNLIIFFQITFLSSCAVVHTRYEDLPTKNISTITKTSIINPTIIKHREATSLNRSFYCSSILWVWGNTAANEGDLIKKLKEEAVKNNAPLVLRSDLRHDSSSSQSVYLGYGLTQTSPILLPMIDARLCHYSKVQFGARFEKNGIISYVNDNSPASKSGLKEGMKILKLNETFVPGNDFAIDLEIRAKNPGDRVLVEYLDINGKKNKTTITLDPVK